MVGCSSHGLPATDLGVVGTGFGSRVVRDRVEAESLLSKMAAYPKEPWAYPPLPAAGALLTKIDFAHQVLVVTEFPTLCTHVTLRKVVVTATKATFKFEPNRAGPYACFGTAAVHETHALVVEASTVAGVDVVEGVVNIPGFPTETVEP